jgi:uncharacterized protein (TIGR03086 family)
MCVGLAGGDNAAMTGAQSMASGQPDRVAQLLDVGLDLAAARLASSANQMPDPSTTSTAGGLMDPLTQLRTLGPLLGDVVGAIRADQLDAPTPCSRFTVRDVLDHMIGGATTFAAAFRGTPPPAGSAPAADSSPSVLAAFGPALSDLAAAISEPGALDRTVSSPFGDVQGEFFARFVVLDGLVHGWDLSVATGQAYSPPDELVIEVTSFASGVLDGVRGEESFGPATEPPAGATPIERLVAFTGRKVQREPAPA